MNFTGTVLEKSDSNEMFVKFKNQIGETHSLDYEWKCFILKKYFKDNMILSLIRFFIGVLLLVLCSTSVIYKMLGNKSFVTIIVIACLLIGVILTGSGVLFFFSNMKRYKNYPDFLWDDESISANVAETNITREVVVKGGAELVNAIIKFYDKSH